MSKTIDERVVEMRFDNQQFENNVKTSMSTIEKLKQALHFKDTKSGIDNLNSSIKGVNLNPLAQGVDSVKAKFSALEVMGVTALANITNSAINAGKNLVSSLTIDPIKSGFQEYETQINAVQTILANTSSQGTTLEQVNAALDELNLYADKTIYNFTEMTKNIGTFTAAGVDLDTSVNAIQGIANLAAVSGSTSQQASTAMYQLSQALAAGTVKLMDWNSVVNAGMGGQVFQTALRETSEELQTGAEAAIAAEGSFRDSLSTGWLTSEVLTETLKKFTTSGANQYVAEYCGITEEAVQASIDAAEAQYGEAEAINKASEALASSTGKSKDEIAEVLQFAKTAEDAATKVKTFTQLLDTLKEAAQSGWTQTWETIVGDFEEAKALWTEASDFFGGIIQSSADSRNQVVEEAFGSKWNQFSEVLTKAGVSVDTFQSKLEESLNDTGVSLSDLIKQYGSLAGAMSSGKISKSAIFDALTKLGVTETEVSETTAQVTTDITKFQDAINKVIKGDFGNGTARVEALTEAGYEYATVQKLINKIYEKNGKTWKDTTISAEDLTDAIGELSDEELESIGYTQDQVTELKDLAAQAEESGMSLEELVASFEKPSGRTLVVDTIRNAITALVKVLSSVKEAWREFFQPISGSQIYSVIESIHSLSEKLIITDESADKLKRTFAGLFSVLDLVRIMVSGTLGAAFSLISKILGKLDLNILDFTASLGDALVAFHDWILEHSVFAKVVDKIIELIAKVIEKIKDWIKEFLELPQVTEKIEKFHEVASKALEWVCDGIDDLIDKIGDLDNVSLKDISSSFKNFGQKIRDSLFDSEGDFIGLDTILDEFPVRLRNFVDKAISAPLLGSGNSISAYSQKMISSFQSLSDIVAKNVGLGELFTAAFGVSLTVALSKTSRVATKVLDTISGPFKELNGFVRAAQGTLLGFTKVLKGLEFSAKATGILKIAGAVAILAGSMYLLSQISLGGLAKATAAIIIIGGVLTGLSIVSSKFGSVFKWTKSGGLEGTVSGIVGLAVAIGLLVASLKVISTMTVGDIIKGLAVVAALLAGVIGSCALLSKYAKELPACALTIASVGAAIWIMAKALETIANIKFTHYIEDIAAMIVMIGGLALVIRQLGKLEGFKWQSGFGILALAASLWVLAKGLEAIANMDLAKVQKNIGNYVLVFGTLIGLMALTRIAGQYAASGGVGILAMAAAIGILAIAMRMIGKMDSGELNQAVTTVGKLFVIFGLVVALSKFAGAHALKAGAMILIMAVALDLLVLGIVALSHVDATGLEKAVNAISQVMIVFGLVVALSGFAKGTTMGPIIGIAISLGVLMVALGTLAMIPQENLAKAVAAIELVMAGLSSLLISTKFVKGSWSTLTALGGMLTVIGGILVALTAMDSGDAIKAAASISMVLGSLSAVLIATKFTPEFGKKTLIALISMTAVVTAIAAIITGLDKLKVDTSLKNATAISEILLAFSGALAILSIPGLAINPASAASVALALSAFVGVVGGISTALAAVTSLIPQGGIDVITKGFENLQTIFSGIGSIIGSFTGGLIGGLGSGITTGLKGIGEDLAAFSDAVGPFLTLLPNIDENTLDKVDILSNALLKLISADFLSELTSLGQNDISTTFANELTDLGNGLKSFVRSMNGLTELASTEDIEAVTTIINGLAELSSSIGTNTTSLKSLIVGCADLGNFGEDIAKLGNGLKAFAGSVKGMSGTVGEGSDIEAAISVANSLVTLNGTLPTSGGLFSFIMGGSQSMTGFALGVTFLGQALKSFCTKVEGIAKYQGDVTAAATIAAGIQTVVDNAPTVGVGGGLKELFGGIFKTAALSQIGHELITFAKKVEGISQYQPDVGAAATIASQLKATINNLPESGSLDGKMNLAYIGDQFKELSNKLKDVDLSKVTSLVTSVRSLATSFKALSGIDYSCVTSLKKAISELGTLNAGSLSSSLGSASSTAAKLATSIVSSMAKAITSKGNLVATAFKSIINKGVSSLKSGTSKFRASGTLLITSLAAGITSSKSKVISAITTVLNAAVSKINGFRSKFKQAGLNAAQGLVQGIKDKSSAAYAAGVALGQAASNGLKASLDINSPSKVTMAHGLSMGEGLVLGINKSFKSVYDAGYSLGQDAVTALSDSISDIATVLSDDVDLNPTIKPVLDLDNIESGTKSISEMLNLNSSLNLSANTGAISYMMRNIQNGASNDDVVNAIGVLSGKLDNISNPIYNVNGITYDDGTNISEAVRTLVRAAKIERRI